MLSSCANWGRVAGRPRSHVHLRAARKSPSPPGYCAMRLLIAIALTSVVAGLPVAGAQTVNSEEHTLRVVRIVERLEHPWGLAFLPDGRMLVTERPGRLRIVSADGRLAP